MQIAPCAVSNSLPQAWHFQGMMSLFCCITLGAERRARRLHRRWEPEVTARSSAWFEANCRLVYYWILPSGAGPGAMSEAQRRTIIRLRIVIS
jgi:hypothetical protein